MRFYDIIIKNKEGKVQQSPSLSGVATENFRTPSLLGFQLPVTAAQKSQGTKQKSSYTSYVNGQTLPGALQVVMNIPVYTQATPGAGTIDIWGVSKEEISQSFNLVGMDIEVYGGMRKGLPLAKPNQSQLPLAVGKILNAYGSWQGTEQVLHLVIRPDGVGRAGDYKNFQFSLKANGSLKDAILETMKKAMPRAKVAVHIADDELKWSTDLTGVYPSLSTFAIMLKQMTQDNQFQGISTTTGQKYGGIEVLVLGTGKEVVFTDRTVQLKGGKEIKSGDKSGAIQINFEDMIGQPVWQGISQISFKTIMRSDISMADKIKIPEAVVPLTTFGNPAASGTEGPGGQGSFPSRNRSTFKGDFIVTSVRHMGNFRQGTGDAWVTQYVAIVANKDQEKIPPGTVTVGEPQKVAPQETTINNPTPPNVITTQMISGFPAAQETQSTTAPQPGDSVSGPFLRTGLNGMPVGITGTNAFVFRN